MPHIATAPDRFQDLLTDFGAAHQTAIDAQALGIEFEAEGYRALIAPDPRDPDRMLIGGIGRAAALQAQYKILSGVAITSEGTSSMARANSATWSMFEGRS